LNSPMPHILLGKPVPGEPNPSPVVVVVPPLTGPQHWARPRDENRANRHTVCTMSASSKSDDRKAEPRGPPTSTTERRRQIKQRIRELPSRSRRVISEHRHRRKQRDCEVSDQSRHGLDWTNFFMADVQVGFGSFLAFYLAEAGWSKQSVGLALTVGGLAGVLAQAPGGALAD